MIIKIRKKRLRILFDLFNIKNVNFLFGAGTSNGAIPTMEELRKRVIEELDNKEKELFNKNDKQNLEKTLEILYSGKTYFENNPQGKDNREFNTLKNLIEKLKKPFFKQLILKLVLIVKMILRKKFLKTMRNFTKRLLIAIKI